MATAEVTVLSAGAAATVRAGAVDEDALWLRASDLPAVVGWDAARIRELFASHGLLTLRSS